MNPQKPLPPAVPDTRHDMVLRHLSRAMQGKGISAGCPDDTQLAALAEGNLPDDERERLYAHLAECETCLETYRLLRNLLLEEMPERRGKHLWRPMALAASLVLVVMSLLLLNPRGRELAPQIRPAAPSFDKAEEIATAAADEAPGKKGFRPDAEGAIKEKRQAPPPPSHKVAAPAPKQLQRKQDPVPPQKETLETEALPPMQRGAGSIGKKGHPEAKKARRRASQPRETFAVTARVGNAYGTRFPLPPDGTPAARVRVCLEFTSSGRVEKIALDPADSPLAAFLRQTFKRVNLSQRFFASGYHCFLLEWDGDSWRIQPSGPADSENPVSGGDSSGGTGCGSA